MLEMMNDDGADAMMMQNLEKKFAFSMIGFILRNI